MSELIVGIDLGTTNSEIAAFKDGQVRVLGPGDKILPSCVGLAPTGELLVGQPARNQQTVYPDRTIRSIKRKMGSREPVQMGEKSFTPPEISALILRELASWAERDLGSEIKKAVITVPAYFSDAQRNATREAGALAGLEVVRILNEPTAASLAYGFGEGGAKTAMVYDLGGGTFDVSIVTIEGDVTEVLASHGNNQLGGDDFDDLLVEKLASEFQQQHSIDLRTDMAARARLWWAAEDAKKRLSSEQYVKIREEALAVRNGNPLHLEFEISREEYEELIRPLMESTLDSVSKALEDSHKSPRDIDAVLLVGGSTRTPLVGQLLREKLRREPRQDVHPDLCVALGAGVLASRLGGHSIERVLVDISPYSFGVSYEGERGGVLYPYCYKAIIERNTPLPITRSDRYYTAAPFQTAVDVHVYQGDDDDALKNVPVGDFRISGLSSVMEPNEVLCRMALDIDGILHVTAVEKRTGKSKTVTIANATQAKSEEEIAEARKRIEAMFSTRDPEHKYLGTSAGAGDGETIDIEAESVIDEGIVEPETAVNGKTAEGGWATARHQAKELVERSRTLLGRMHAEDREEAIELNAQIESAIASRDEGTLVRAAATLKELLFFIEGAVQ